MSYAVTRRTREIVLRVAVGAQQPNVLWRVLRETLAFALFGIGIGIPSALAATRLIASMFFDLSPSDPQPSQPSLCYSFSSHCSRAIYQPAALPPSTQSSRSVQNESG
jgi:ABC-type antimicrobial peptide transport system permease subunit